MDGIAICAVHHVIHHLGKLLILHCSGGAVQRLPPGACDQLLSTVAVGVVGIIIHLCVGLHQIVEGFLFFNRVELEQHIVFHGVGQIAVVGHLIHGVGRRRLAGLAPLDHVFIHGNLGLDLNVGVKALAVEQRHQLQRMAQVAVAVFQRVFGQEIRIVVIVLQIIAGSSSAKHDLSAQVGQLFIVEDDQRAQHGVQTRQDVVVVHAADVAARLARDLRSAIEHLGSFPAGRRSGKIGVVIDQIEVERAGHIGRVFVRH